jgi:DNA ligase D-like protein (predicted ligase)
MLATLVDQPFSDPNWIYETKFDGVRALAFRDGRGVRLLSRNQKLLNRAYPELIAPLASQPSKNYVIDGEIVAFKNGVSSFSLLQRRMQVRDPQQARKRGVQVFYCVFDLLLLDGEDLRTRPLLERKRALKAGFRLRPPLRFVGHRTRDGEAFFQEACKEGLEGLIAKRADSAYVSKRSRDWLKFKCSAEQELVILGYTDPKGERVGFGALLLGYYERGHLKYAGKVGTGFDTAILLKLSRELAYLHTGRSPVTATRNLKGVHWVRPKLVAQVAFTEWTRDGKLRHPRFLGLRSDKAARGVVRERPK